MPIITAPDGTNLNIPDDASPEVKKAFADKFAAMKSGGVWEGVKEAGRALHQGVVGGLTGLGGMAGDAIVGGADLAAQLFAGTPEGTLKPRMMPSEALKTITGGNLVDRPKTTPGKYAGAIGEGAVGALTGNPASIPKALITGGMAGGGSELAAKTFGDNMLTRVLGGVAGGLGGGMLTAPTTNAAGMAKAALEGTSETELQLAKDRMVQALADKQPINLSQAMGRDSNVDKLVDVLANSREGVKTTALLRDQPAQALQATERFQGSLPGAVRTETNMANQVQDAATKRLKELGAERSQAWTDAVAASASATGGARIVPLQGAINVLKTLDSKIAEFPGSKQSEFLKNNLRNKLVDDVGMPLTNPAQINQILKEAARDLKPQGVNGTVFSGESTKYLDSIIIGMRDDYGKAFEPIRAGNAAYKNFTESQINPVKEGVIGTLAGPKGSIEGKAAAKGKLEAIFNRGSNENAAGTSDILTTAKQLNRAGEGQTFVDGAKTWLSNKVESSIKTTGERGNEDIAKVLHNAFFATNLQKQGFRDTMAGIADIHGVPRKGLVDGAEKFFNYLGQLSRRPGEISGVSGEAFRRQAEDSLFGKMGQVSVITPLRQPVLKYVDWLRSNSYKAMDDLVNTPAGVDMLQKLSKSSNIGPVQAAAISTFLGTATQVDNPQIPQQGTQ